MRLGKWIRVFDKIVPIPMTLAASFGLREGSRLYLAPMRPMPVAHGQGVEIIVSPVPTPSWRSLCRLSVRLRHKPHALAAATAFLREKQINIVLTEAAATFQEQAHWDAVCDLRACPEYLPILNQPVDEHEQRMQELLDRLTREMGEFADAPENAGVFLSGRERHAVFSGLSGLNHASFRCDLALAHAVIFRAGGIELPDALVGNLRAALGSLTGLVPPVPPYALITGNTEQRYLRLHFIHDVDSFVMAVVELDVKKMAGDGVGALNQLLRTLPPDINVLRLATHIVQHPNAKETGYVQLIGHWPAHDQDELEKLIGSMDLEDIDGVRHAQCARLVDFATPRTAYPRVFISYSTRSAVRELEALRNKLIENNFEPVVGTDIGQPPRRGGGVVTPDVTESSFQRISTCVAFISLQTRRNDFALPGGRWVLPPWTVAEEVFAYSRGVPFLARLRDAAVEDPRYNRHAMEFVFANEKEFDEKVVDLMHALNEYRQGEQFEHALRSARRTMFKPRHPPAG